MLTQNQIVRIHHFGLTCVFDGKNNEIYRSTFCCNIKKGLLTFKTCQKHSYTFEGLHFKIVL